MSPATTARRGRKRAESRGAPSPGDDRIALVGPDVMIARALRTAVAARLPGARLEPFSLARLARDPNAPLRTVLCPSGTSLAADLEFLRSARRKVLWPTPGADLWGAIAGLRGAHDTAPRGARPPAPGRSGRRTALLLEGNVTFDRAQNAASSGAPRDWIVERVQRVRIGESGLQELRRLGIRWSVLEPVEVVALSASASLARARHLWAKLLPSNVRVWVMTAA
jgi:hypothetical protein